MKKSPLLPWSYSRLSKYEKCPAQANYAYTLNRPYVQGAAAQRGSAAHKTMEDFLAGKTHDLHDAILPHKHILHDLRKKKPFVELEIAVDENWKLASWTKCWGRGGVDAGYVEKTTVEMCEWKTGKMYDDHADQRRLYLLLAAAKFLKAQLFRITSYYFDLGQVKELKATREQLDPIREDFNARIAIMSNDDIFAPRPGWYCAYCDYSRQKGGPCRHG
jgi:CRISPR/Cas system-associated exonuclease Cas4 (RecB family)